jgi:HAD superfamily hydrolase (TIGR01509 family)
MVKALIFDVDGTLADTETVHLAAFNEAFGRLDIGWRWDMAMYRRLLAVAGGKERIQHYWLSQASDGRNEIDDTMLSMISRLHAIKTECYTQAVANGAVKIRPGIADLIDEASREGLAMAIATTTTAENVVVLLENFFGSDWRSRFAVIEDASTAERKKPHPQVYLQALDRLGLDAGECVAFEDSENGLRAAVSAGLRTVVTYNGFTEDHDFSGALTVLPSLSGVCLADIERWVTTETKSRSYSALG